MPDSNFRSFHAVLPPTGERIPYDSVRHDKFATMVPPALAEEWRNFGFGAYGDGLIWTCEPDLPVLQPDDWPALNNDAIDVLRTAFGDVCVWQNGQFLWQAIHSGRSQVFGSNPKVLFLGLSKEMFRKDSLLEPLFHIAVKRLGNIDRDECFGFAPLPALGGAIAEQYLIKTLMRPYVAMAAQVLG